LTTFLFGESSWIQLKDETVRDGGVMIKRRMEFMMMPLVSGCCFGVTASSLVQQKRPEDHIIIICYWSTEKAVTGTRRSLKSRFSTTQKRVQKRSRRLRSLEERD
jgi:hypothetical protein